MIENNNVKGNLIFYTKTIVNTLRNYEFCIPIKYNSLRCKLVMALDIAFGLVGRQSSVGSGEPGELGEQGSLCFKLPEILSILCGEA